MLSFNIDTSKGETPASVARKRAIVQALMAQRGVPKNVGEGLNALGDGIVENVLSRRADAAEGAGRAGADDRYYGMVNAGTFPSAPSLSSAQSSATSSQAASSASAPDGVADGIRQTADALGIDPVDLGTAISYETAGTFDPTKNGPHTQWGQHRGLIQFGEPQAKQYGVDWNNPVASQLGPDGAVAKYLRATGVKPGMGLLDVYSAINAGGVGKYDASDAGNGGAPGTVRDKVERQMADHRAKAMALLGPSISAPAVAANEALATGQPVQVASNDPSIGMSPAPAPLTTMAPGTVSPAYDPSGLPPLDPNDPMAPAPQPSNLQPGVDVGAPGAVSPAGQRVLSTMMDKTPIGGVVQALSAAQPPAQASAAVSPVTQALAAAQQPQQAAPASPAVQKVSQAMQPQEDLSNIPVEAGGDRGAIQPGQAGPSLQDLMRAASDPWLSEEQRGVVNLMLKQKIDQSDPGNQLDMDYKRAQIAALNAKQDALPDSVKALKERASAAGLVEGTQEYKNFMVTGGHGPQTVINTGDNSSVFAKKSDESAAKRMDDIVQAGQTAPQTMADMQQLVDLGAQIGTGKLADWKSTLGPYAQAAGTDVSGMDEIQAYKAITSRLAPQMRAVGSGSSSDTDVALFMQSLPNLRNTQGGNEMIANTMKSVAQNKINAAEIARKAQRGDISWQDADEQISKLPNPYDLFKQFQKDSQKKTVIDGYTIEEVQ